MPLKRSREVNCASDTTGRKKQLRASNTDIHQTGISAGNSATSLLGLPRELRDQIYHEVWSETNQFKVEYDNIDYLVHYEVPGREMTPWSPTNQIQAASQPPWFLANKQILEEAIDQFHRNSFWIYCRYDFQYEIPSRPRLPLFLLSPWNGRTLSLPDIMCRRQDMEGPVIKSKLVCWSEAFHRLDPDIIITPNLHHLQMGLLVGWRQTISESEAANTHFGFLQHLKPPNLQTVDIVVNWEGIDVPGNATSVDRFRERVTELGMGLIGNSGTAHFESVEGDYSLREPSWIDDCLQLEAPAHFIFQFGRT